MQIHELPTISGSPSGGYFATDNGTQTTKIDYDALAKAIIEQYAASTLAGSAQSVKAALDGIGELAYAVNYKGMGRIAQNDDLNSYTTPGSYVATSTGITTSLTNCPINNSGFSLHVESVAGGKGQLLIQTIKRTSSNIGEVYLRTYTGSVWGAWEKVPTRAEVDALNSKFDGNSIQFVNMSGSSGNTNNAIRFRGTSESDTTEHEYTMFGISSGNRGFGFYAYIRYSSQTCTVYSFGEVQCTGSISGDTAIVKVGTWMKAFGIVRNKVASIDYTNVS